MFRKFVVMIVCVACAVSLIAGCTAQTTGGPAETAVQEKTAEVKTEATKEENVVANNTVNAEPKTDAETAKEAVAEQTDEVIPEDKLIGSDIPYCAFYEPSTIATPVEGAMTEEPAEESADAEKEEPSEKDQKKESKDKKSTDAKGNKNNASDTQKFKKEATPAAPAKNNDASGNSTGSSADTKPTSKNNGTCQHEWVTWDEKIHHDAVYEGGYDDVVVGYKHEHWLVCNTPGCGERFHNDTTDLEEHCYKTGHGGWHSEDTDEPIYEKKWNPKKTCVQEAYDEVHTYRECLRCGAKEQLK